LTLDPEQLADVAAKARRRQEHERKIREAARAAEAQANLSKLLPIIERFIHSSAHSGHVKATVYQWTRRTALGYPYGFFYASRYPLGDYHAHTMMIQACLPLVRSYDGVIPCEDVAEYIGTHFRQHGFRVDTVPDNFRLGDAAVDEMWWGEGWSVVVSWETPSPDSVVPPTPAWKGDVRSSGCMIILLLLVPLLAGALFDFT
jgi:hypothetical protein